MGTGSSSGSGSGVTSSSCGSSFDLHLSVEIAEPHTELLHSQPESMRVGQLVTSKLRLVEINIDYTVVSIVLGLSQDV